jgi:hypothetical protein
VNETGLADGGDDADGHDEPLSTSTPSAIGGRKED